MELKVQGSTVEQPKNQQIQTRREYINPNGVDKTPTEDTIQLSNRAAKSTVGFITAALKVTTSAAKLFAKMKPMSEEQKFEKALAELKQCPAQIVGNNKVSDETSAKSMQAVEEIIEQNPGAYKAFLEIVKKMTTPLDEDLMPKDGVIYHGTNLEGAKKIVENGVTPFVENANGRELGSAFYTSPDSRVADFFGANIHKNGIVIPFKLNTQKIGQVEPENLRKINEACNMIYSNLAVDTSYFKEEGVEVPSTLEPLFKPQSKNVVVQKNIISALKHKAFKDLGYDAIYMDKAIDGIFAIGYESITETLEKAKGIPQSQFVVFDGTKVELLQDKIRAAEKI